MVKIYHHAAMLLPFAVALLGGCRTVAPPCSEVSMTILRGGTVFAGDDLKPIEHATIVIERGVIAGIFAANEVAAIDRCAAEVDATGSFILPGLWDAHLHISKVGDQVLGTLPSLGITGVRDMGSSIAQINELRRRSEMGVALLPHIATPGPMYEAAATFETHADQRTLEPWQESRRPIPPSREQLTEELRELKRSGAGFAKVRSVEGREQFLQFLLAASDAGLDVVTHPPPDVAPEELEGKGVLSIEHASYPYPIVGGPMPEGDVISAFKRAGIVIVPTVVAWRTQVASLEALTQQIDRALTSPELLQFVPPALAVEWKLDLERKKPRTATSLEAWRSFHDQLLRDLRALHAGGVPLVAGSDAGVEGIIPGVSLLDELCALAREVGMPPLTVLRANSVLAARLAGMSRWTGSIAPGKSADLIVLGRDPRRGVEALQSLQFTYLRGERVRGGSNPGVCR